jgi:catalase
VRYQFVPRAAEHYLTPEQRRAQSGTYLQDEIIRRAGRAPIEFDWYAQIAEDGDAIADPSIAWPDSRRLVRLGTITLTGQPDDVAGVEKTLLFLPGQPHAGVEPADPMLVMRNTAYPISLGERQ